MSTRYLCAWGHQWRNARLTNPQKKGKKYFADIYIFVRCKAAKPPDTEVSYPGRHGDLKCVKTVSITYECWLKLGGRAQAQAT